MLTNIPSDSVPPPNFSITENARIATAYREATSAVVALHRGCEYDSVSLAPDAVPLAAMLRARLLEEVELHLEVREEIRENLGWIEDVIVVSLAGPMGQQRHDPAWEDDEKPSFWTDTLPEWRSYILPDASDAGAEIYEKHLASMAGDVIEREWAHIEAVAQRLLKDGALSAEDVISMRIDLLGTPAG